MHPLLDQYFGLVRKFLPSEEEENAVGLDIGTGDCKVVELKKSGNAYEMLNFAVEPIVQSDVSRSIKNVLTRLEVPCKTIYTSVFGKGTLIRYIELPRMPAADLKKSFAIEADKYFPFTQDQIYTDCYVLDPQGKGKEMSVMAAAAKKEMVDERLKLLSSLGLQTGLIGINPIALMNVINMLGIDDAAVGGKAIALLDMGDAVSNLTVIKDRLPRFTRDIFIGGHELTKRISNALSVNFQEAEKYKINPGDKIKEVNTACESAILNIVQELRLSFDYFVTEKNTEVGKLLLTGGGSMLGGIVELFEKHLEIKVEQWNPTASLKLGTNVPATDIQKMSPKLGVAVGLALYHYD